MSWFEDLGQENVSRRNQIIREASVQLDYHGGLYVNPAYCMRQCCLEVEMEYLQFAGKGALLQC